MPKLTDVLDLAGALATVAAVVVLVWPWTVAGAIAAGGLGLLALSWSIDRARRPKTPKRKRKGGTP